MDYKDKVCPLCGKQFEKNDDVVVCPECGTPQHRECYESLGHCVNSEKHGTGFSWNESEQNKSSGQTVKCPVCQTENSDDSLFCKRCAAPLTNDRVNKENNNGFGSGRNPNQQGMPFMPIGGIPFQQFSVLKDDDDIGEGIKAKEMEKLVQKNVPFYMMLFTKLKKFGSSRFSFVGFLFTGIWYLYRKQYLKGAVISIIMALSMILSAVFTPFFMQTFESIEANLTAANPNAYATSNAVFNEVFKLPADQQVAFFIPLIAMLVTFAVRVYCGLTANRSYYNHCIKTITKLKIENKTSQKLNPALEKKGGVDVGIAICAVVCYIIINYAPNFFY